jgi:hypothetical protein
MNKLNFFQKRDFGENISFSLQFFKQNFLHYFITQYVLSLPIWIGLGVFFYFSIENFKDILNFMSLGRVELSILLFYIISIVIGCYVLCISYNYHILYINRGLKNFNYQDVLSETISSYGRALVAYVFLTVSYLVVSTIFSWFLQFIGIAGVYILLIVLVAIFTYLVFTVLSVVQKKLNLIDSVKYSITLVRDNWWKTFGVFFIVFIMSYLLLYIANVIIFFILSFTFISFRSFTSDLVENKGILIILIVLFFSLSINIMSMILNTTTFALYGSLVEEKEGVHLKQNIDKLGTTSDTEKEEEDF